MMLLGNYEENRIKGMIVDINHTIVPGCVSQRLVDGGIFAFSILAD